MKIREILTGTAIAIYVSGFVASFGYAYVESEESARNTCLAYYTDKSDAYKTCVRTTLVPIEAMFKSGVWPLWLSYQIAKK